MPHEEPRPPLPDFLIIGVQKGGTTWLRRMLRRHPGVYMPEHEVHFFDKSYNYRKGPEWYRGQFAEAAPEQTVGEKTPDYFWAEGDGVEGHLPKVHEHIYDLLPDSKLILLFRNPVDRAVSAVKHIIRSGRVSPRHSLDDLLVGPKHHLVSGHGVLEYGHYHQHLRTYLELFEESQILTLFFEETVVESPREGLGRVFEFLDLPDASIEGVDQKVHAHKATLLELYAQYYAPPLAGLAERLRETFPRQVEPPSEATYRTLYDHYEPHNQRLADLLDRPLPESWHAP